MGQVSNTLLITDIVYGKGPGINTYGMPKGLALKMNKDEEAARKPCSEMCTCPATTSQFLIFNSGILYRWDGVHRSRSPTCADDSTQQYCARIFSVRCSGGMHRNFIMADTPNIDDVTCLYTREVYFYSSGLQVRTLFLPAGPTSI